MVVNLFGSDEVGSVVKVRENSVAEPEGWVNRPVQTPANWLVVAAVSNLSELLGFETQVSSSAPNVGEPKLVTTFK